MIIRKFTPHILTSFLLLFAFQLSAKTVNPESGLVADEVLLWSLIGVITLLIIVNLVLKGTIKSFSSDKNIWAVVKEKSLKSNAGGTVLVVAIMLTNLSSFAGSGKNDNTAFIMESDLFYALLTMISLLLFLLFYQIKVLRNLMNLMAGDAEEEDPEERSAWVSVLTDVI